MHGAMEEDSLMTRYDDDWLLNLSCGECNVVSLYFLYCSINRSICVACLTVFVNCLVKQFAIFGCGCYFVVECYGSVECGWRCSVG